MLARIICLLALFWAPMARAQVNIEKLRTEAHEDGFSGAISLNTALSIGNIDFADFGLGSFLEHKKGKHIVFLVTNGRFAAKRTQADYLEEPDVSLWDKEAHFSNAALSHLRYNYDLGHGLAWELYSQYEFNEFLLLDLRLLGGTGVRYKIVQGKAGGLWAGTSAMLESERLNPESIAPDETANQQTWRWSSYATGKWIISDTTNWLTTIYYQPNVSDFADHRVVGETGLSLGITEHFALTLDARVRHDSLPPRTADGIAEVVSTDVSVKNGISVKW